MARTYAAIMAQVAMLVVLLRALKNHAGFEETILTALAWMGILGTVGLVLGLIAQNTVDHSVMKLVQTELEALQPKQEPTQSEPAS